MKFLHFFTKSNYAIFLALLIVVSFILPNNVFSAVMQSSTYKIQTDNLNFGGIDSGSINYKVRDSLGEIATGDSNSANYYMKAGYWQMQESSISISAPSDLVMDSMSGLSGGSSEGLMSWVITTDNTAGYNMTINSSTSPSLKSALDSLADYVPAGIDPDYNFTNLPANSSFGFSPEGTEVVSKFKDNGSICNTGSLETTGKCWEGLSTTPKIVTGSSSSNMPSGATSTIRFRAESGANRIQISGQYTVTITATATTL